MKTVWKTIRWLFAVLVLGGSFKLFLDTLGHVPGPTSIGLPFWLWYGNWPGFLSVAATSILFLLAFTLPRRKVEWRNAGLFTAFFISLFFEMFGLPLTIFVLAPLLDVPIWIFGHMESHLWAFALAWLGILPLHLGTYAVMVVSMGLIAMGVGLVAIGWATIYRGRKVLVTHGIYSLIRHPQYLGLILIILAFNIQWPTLPTLFLGPLLIALYIRQARREDKEIKAIFGQEFIDYANRVRAFFPLRRSSSQSAAIRLSEEKKIWMIVIPLAWIFTFAVVSAKAAPQNLSVEETLSALGKGHALGSANAPVTIVEFSDFQCSFCKKFWVETLPKLKQTYVKKGQIRFIYRHFAILGKLSEQAAQAAECAGEQGKFWEYHDRRFANQGAFIDGKLKTACQWVEVERCSFQQMPRLGQI